MVVVTIDRDDCYGIVEIVDVEVRTDVQTGCVALGLNSDSSLKRLDLSPASTISPDRVYALCLGKLPEFPRRENNAPSPLSMDTLPGEIRETS
ncbi:hypothetical protein V1477_016238 [Vespula maculifrons]|uniref:Uncharacterized protein n=4 Tax=Vespula TaxID=7451 RepID=A0A834K9I9_VESGE|nr:hypothetical protein HZH66_006740 [Vespula vulgaris]KAF7401666.1 hypothetical protein HZH68_007486 [Vespula germanica]KAF7425616.1 hypothetical protein H0235_008054 [Vespula pensylvanica]